MSDPFPYMPFQLGKYRSMTPGLETIEHGALLLLLMALWTAGGGLPDDDRRLARVAGLSARQWARVRPVLVPRLLHVEGGLLVSNFVLEMLTSCRRRSAAASANAKRKQLKYQEARAAVAELPLSDSPANKKKSIITTTSEDAAREPQDGMREAERVEASTPSNDTTSGTIPVTDALRSTRLVRAARGGAGQKHGEQGAATA